ncbi:hypothetical protein AB0M02_36390 [Actinoplanes sp. NPDC051861]|uniref:hypothetical protein n=1 Tax=Actinoplanes sp. NPDC051861 TaxID=3155170 RepID=UPI00341CB23C
MYAFGHEQLQHSAVEWLGPARLREYRRRLHDWADRHRDQQWRDGTPDYLLDGYFRMLRDDGELDRIVAWATDGHRHDRLLRLSGSDVSAFAEIAVAQERLLDSPDGPFADMLRVAAHRESLVRRTSAIPVRLPAVWASLGWADRATDLARSLPSPLARARALAHLAAEVHIGAERRTALVREAEACLPLIVHPPDRLAVRLELMHRFTTCRSAEHLDQLRHEADGPLRDRVLAELAAEEADPSAAVAAARSIADRAYRDPAHEQLAVALARAGDLPGARAAIHAIRDRSAAARTWLVCAGAAWAAGDRAEADRFAGEAERAARDVPGEARSLWALIEVLDFRTRFGDRQRSSALARFLETESWLMHGSDEARILREHLRYRVDGGPRPPRRPRQPSVAAVRDAVDSGDYAHAASVAELLQQPAEQVRAWVLVAVAAALAGHDAVAAHAGERAEALVDGLDERWAVPPLLTGLAAAAAFRGERDRAAALASRAESLARSGGEVSAARLADVTEVPARTAALERAEAFAAEGDIARAEASLGPLTGPAHRDRAWATICRNLRERGQNLEAGLVSRKIVNPVVRAEARGVLFLSERGYETTGWSFPVPDSDFISDDRLAAVAVAAEEALDRGDVRLARETISGPGCESPDLDSVRGRVCRAMAEAGDVIGAELLSRSITDQRERDSALGSLARALLNAGDAPAATRMARDVAQKSLRLRLLLDIAEGAGPGRGRETVAEIEAGPDLPMAIRIRLEVVHGNLSRAEQLAAELPDREDRAAAMTDLAAAVARAGHEGRAGEILDRIDPDELALWRRRELAPVMAACGRVRDAARLLDAVNAEAGEHRLPMGAPHLSDRRFVEQSLRHAGPPRTLAVARHIADPQSRAGVLTLLAGRVDRIADPATAAAVLREACAAAEALTDVGERAALLTHLLVPAAATGDLRRCAAALLAALPPGEEGFTTLRRAAEAMAKAGETSAAVQFARLAVERSSQFGRPAERASAVRSILEAGGPDVRADAGILDAAESAALAIEDPDTRFPALVALARIADDARAARLLKHALPIGPWSRAADVIKRLEPGLAESLAEQARDSDPPAGDPAI